MATIWSTISSLLLNNTVASNLIKNVTSLPITAPLLSLLSQLGIQNITTTPTTDTTDLILPDAPTDLPPPAPDLDLGLTTSIHIGPIIIFAIALILAFTTLAVHVHGLYVRVLALATASPAPTSRSRGLWSVQMFVFTYWLLGTVLALLPFPSPVYVRIATGLLMARWSQQVTHHCLRLRMVEGEPGVGGAVGRALAEEYVPGLREELELQEGVAPGGWRRVRLEPEWTVGYAVQVALQRAAGWWVGGFVRYWSAGLGKVTGWGGSAGVVVVLIVVRALVNEYLEGWGLAGALVVVWWFLVRVEAGARGMYGARRLGGGLARLAGVFLVTLVVFVVVFGGLVAVLGLWLQAGGLLS